MQYDFRYADPNDVECKGRRSGRPSQWQWLADILDKCPEGQNTLISVPETESIVKLAQLLRSTLVRFSKTRQYHWSVKQTTDGKQLSIERGTLKDTKQKSTKVITSDTKYRPTGRSKSEPVPKLHYVPFPEDEVPKKTVIQSKQQTIPGRCITKGCAHQSQREDGLCPSCFIERNRQDKMSMESAYEKLLSPVK